MSQQRKLLSQRHPVLYFLAVWYRRLLTYRKWYSGKQTFARHFEEQTLPFRVKKHQSLLLRKLGDSDVELQVNKVTNLGIALKHIDGIMIRPGETFSFCRLVGPPYPQKRVPYGYGTFFR